MCYFFAMINHGTKQSCKRNIHYEVNRWTLKEIECNNKLITVKKQELFAAVARYNTNNNSA